MPRLFSVTTATDTLHLDRKRQGEAAFTVTNASGRPLRGRALLQSEDPAAEGWLSLDGEPERNFPIASTEQFNVRINVPPEARAGSYPFRLDMVNVKRTDEDYSRGQSITLEVPEAEPETKSFPTWVLLVAVPVLLLGVFVFRCPIFGCGPSTVTVPGGLEGLSVSQAMDVLDEQGLSVAEEIRSEPRHTIDDGMVIRTDPASGEEVSPDTEITLVVSATLAFQRQWGAEGSGEGQFMLPAGIAVSREGNVYVTDRDRDREIHRVQVFSPEGRFLRHCGVSEVAAKDSSGHLWGSPWTLKETCTFWIAGTTECRCLDGRLRKSDFVVVETLGIWAAPLSSGGCAAPLPTPARLRPHRLCDGIVLPS